MVPAARLFSQLLAQFPRMELARWVAKHRAEYGAKGFTCWTRSMSKGRAAIPHQPE
jgi:hypothetical protein